MEDCDQSVRRLLAQIQAGDPDAANQLFPLVYSELRDLAKRIFDGQRPNHTLQPTALANEAFIRLASQPEPEFSGRVHFLSVAAKAMRQILTDHARRKQAAKRGGRERHQVTLAGLANDEGASRMVDLLALDEAMSKLESLDKRMCRVVELRFFGGLSVEDSAEVLGVCPRTIKEEWRMARSWLQREIM